MIKATLNGHEKKSKKGRKKMADFYNTKVIKYLDSCAVRTYEQPVKTNFHKKDNKDTVDIENEKKVQTTERTNYQIAHSVAVSMNRTKNKIYSYAFSNDWDYFVTFTFNPRIVNSYDYDCCVDVLSNWLHNVKKRRCKNMVYLLVPEYHSDKQKFHFHALMQNINELTFIDSGHIDKRDNHIFNILEYRLGFSTVVKINKCDDGLKKTCNYMLKYITKDLISLTSGKKRYWISRSTIKKPLEDFYLFNADEKQVLEEQCADTCDWCKTVDCSVISNKIKYFDFNNNL